MGAKAVGLDAYDSKPKESWRGWQWNAIVELVSLRSDGVRASANEKRRACQDKVVLYLCGPDDLDGDAALARGFRRENLIAVDIGPENIHRVRASGGIGICSRLEHVISEWGQGQVHVVVADTCSGLDKPATDLLAALRSSKCIGPTTVIAVNLKRGRDPFSNQRRNAVRRVWHAPASQSCNVTIPHEWDVDVPDWTYYARLYGRSRTPEGMKREVDRLRQEKRRLLAERNACVQVCREHDEMKVVLGEYKHRAMLWVSESLHSECLLSESEALELWRAASPRFNSYRTVTETNGVRAVSVMDSAVYRAVLHKTKAERALWLAQCNRSHATKNVRGMVAAAKAVRTMKKARTAYECA